MSKGNHKHNRQRAQLKTSGYVRDRQNRERVAEDHKRLALDHCRPSVDNRRSILINKFGAVANVQRPDGTFQKVIL
jgi:hypothetical protein